MRRKRTGRLSERDLRKTEQSDSTEADVRNGGVSGAIKVHKEKRA